MKKYIIGSILILLLLASIMYFVMTTNAETVVNETTDEVIGDERTFVRMSAALSRGADVNNQVDKTTLQEYLDQYTGHRYRATITEKSSTTLLATFAETGNQYEIDIGTADISQIGAVTYNVDIGTVYTEKFAEGENVLQPTTFTPEKSGWTFAGWREDTTATSDVLTSKDMGTEPITLYAVYKQSVTLSYNGNESTSGSTSSQTGARYFNAAGNYQDPSFTLNENGFTKTNCTFLNWAKGSTSGTQYTAGTSVTLAENTTFYAIWKQATKTATKTGTYTLTLYDTWGTVSKKINFGVTFVSEPTVTCYADAYDPNYNTSHKDGMSCFNIKDLTTSSCTIVFSNYSHDGIHTIYWTAVGEVYE